MNNAYAMAASLEAKKNSQAGMITAGFTGLMILLMILLKWKLPVFEPISQEPGIEVELNLPPEEEKLIPTVSYSLEQSLEALDKDRSFLTAGGVLSDSTIDAYIGLKQQELTRFSMTPHPVEFEMYYSL